MKVRAVGKVVFLKDIERHREKSLKRKGIEENRGDISPTSMTRLKQGLVEGGGNSFNVLRPLRSKALR